MIGLRQSPSSPPSATAGAAIRASRAVLAGFAARASRAVLGGLAAVACLAALAASGASPLRGEPLFTGVFAPGSDAYVLWASPDWRGFEDKWRQLAGQGLRLVAVRAYQQDGRPAYVGAWREGNGAQELAAGLDWPALLARNRQLMERGLRLVDVDTYTERTRRKFLAAWRAGDDRQEIAADLDGPALASRGEGLAARGLRPIRIRAYRLGGRLRFLAVWRSGAGDSSLLTGLDRPGLVRNQARLARRGLQLVDVDAYADDRGRPRFAGIWRAGGGPAALWTGDWENFMARWHELAGGGRRLIALAVAPAPCGDRCANQVVANQAYDYGIRATADHCPGRPGSCGTPGPRDRVVYHWPVVIDGPRRFIRLSAIELHEAPFRLPFSDAAVRRRGAWLYGPGSWHHAADFSRDDGQTFAARAAAAGKVVFTGWDPWSGNTVIVSHDAGGVADAYRTIYMHLRDGASHDCAAAWSQTLAPAARAAPASGAAKDLDAYREHLLATGCAEAAERRRLDPRHWGKEEQRLDPKLLGAPVAAGAFLGWAGDTGPGGKRGPGGPNTHLHVFFAHRDPSDGQWYLFDPYGIYGPPECYPAHLFDPVTGPCVRYPVAWTGGRPRLP